MAKDLFSTQAASYAKHRPSYPAALIEYIAGFVKNKHLAWDCATGNGQAALMLADHFEKVAATDISEKQLQQAVAKENITYAVSKAEQTHFADDSFDLITVAQAYHWFQFAAFEKEVKRVAKPGGVIAVWCYTLPACDDTAINELVKHFYTTVTGPYWDAERNYIDENYQTIPFPFEELPSKEFVIHVQWTKENMAGYFNSWSSVQHYINAHHYNPVDELSYQLSAAWPSDKNELTFIFPVYLRIGRINN